MPDDRPYQGRPSSDRPSFSGPRQFSGPRPNFNNNDSRPSFNNDSRPPFRPAPRVEVPAAPMSHSLRLRDGDREIEVSGSAAFVRQVLDDLPAMWTRLHGEGSTRPARIDLPARTEAPVAALAGAAAPVADEVAPAPVKAAAPAPAAASNGKSTRSTPDDKVLAVLKELDAASRRRGDPQAPRWHLHSAAGSPDPRAQRSKGHRDRRAPRHVPPAVNASRA